MNRLKELRDEKHLTQEELAFELDISQQRISKLERGQTPMSEPFIVCCAKYFGVSTDYLLGVSDIRAEMDFDGIDCANVNESRVRELIYYYSMTDSKGQAAMVEMGKLIAGLSGQEQGKK